MISEAKSRLRELCTDRIEQLDEDFTLSEKVKAKPAAESL
jgi:hypothetical protein